MREQSVFLESLFYKLFGFVSDPGVWRGDVGGSGGRKCGGERESQGRSDSSFIKMEVVF